jgi:predicted small lipoprotein YifL
MVLMACGQKGPLVLPPKDVPPVAKPAPVAPSSDAPEKK